MRKPSLGAWWRGACSRQLELMASVGGSATYFNGNCICSVYFSQRLNETDTNWGLKGKPTRYCDTSNSQLCFLIQIYIDVSVKHNKNLITFIIILGQHVSTLIESSSGPSKNTDPYLAMFKMRCGISNAYILDITMYKMHVSLCSYCTVRILISETLNRYIRRRLHVSIWDVLL